MRFDDGKTDIECRLPFYKEISFSEDFEGENIDVFKYQFISSRLNGLNDYIIRMVFYGAFTVLIMPTQNQNPSERKWFKINQ